MLSVQRESDEVPFASICAIVIGIAAAVVRLILRADLIPADFVVNASAALALVHRLPLYDARILNALEQQYTGGKVGGLFSSTYTSFIGPPTTALFHVPFALVPYPMSAVVYRISAVLAFGGAVYLAGSTLSRRRRWNAWATGALCMGFWAPVRLSLDLGQVDAWIVLALALAVLAAHRHFWKTCGACIGIAVLLKITPGLLLAYCAARKQWAAAATGCLVVMLGLLVAALPRNGEDLSTFSRDVAPRLSGAAIHVQNQALGAFIARLVAPPADLTSAHPLGRFRYVGLTVTSCLLIVFWRANRGWQFDAAEMTIPIMGSLLAGPLTWDHYISWSIIPCMLLLPHLRGAMRLAFVALMLALVPPAVYAFPQLLTPEFITSHPLVRLLTGVGTVAIMGMFVVAICVARRRDDRRRHDLIQAPH